MEEKEIKAVIENLLLASDKPITLDNLQKLFSVNTEGQENTSLEKSLIKRLLDELISEYQERNFHIREIALGYQFASRFEYSPWIKKFYQLDKNNKLSQPALETLSIIAYKQPLTRAEIEDIRGVDAGGVTKTLLEKNLIKIVGKKQVIGRPIMYGTTKKFLEYFGMRDLTDLPSLKEFALDDSEKEELGFNIPENTPIIPESKITASLETLSDESGKDEREPNEDIIIPGGIEPINVTVTEDNLRSGHSLEASS